MSDIPEFRLKPDFLSFCQAKWNGTNYVENTLGEKVQCCLDACKPSVEYCYNSGRSDKECKSIITACEDNCLLYQSTSLEPLVECVSDICDGKGPSCFTENRDEILKCCRKNCTECDIECDDYFLSTYMGNTSLQQIRPKIGTVFMSKTNSVNWGYYVIGGIFTIFALYCLWKLRKKN